jgi:hypothetical protein
METLLILGTSALGYYLNGNRKSIDTNVKVSSSDVPSGNGNIYDSDRSIQIKQDELKMAIPKYNEKVKRMFPYDYQKPNSVFPAAANDSNDINPSVFGILGNSTQDNFRNNLLNTTQVNNNYAAFNPYTSKQIVSTDNALNSPMFQGSFVPTQPYNDQGQPISLLSGQPLDTSHMNMNQEFGSVVKQPMMSNDNAYSLLERYTGVPSVENQGTYSMKREVINPLPSNPENPILPNLSQLHDRYSRANTAVGKTGINNFVSPVKQFRDIPFNQDTRVIPKNIDQTRSKNNQKMSYKGVMTGGQKGSTRGMVPTLRDNPYSLLTELNPNDYAPNKSVVTSSKVMVYPNVNEDTIRTQEYNASYKAPPQFSSKFDSISNTYKTMYQDINHDRVNRDIGTFKPGFGTAVNTTNSKTVRSGYQLLTGNKENLAKQNAGHDNRLGYYQNVNVPDYTLRDSVTQNTTGAINPSMNTKYNSAYQKIQQGIDLEVTNTELNIHNKYTGQGHYDLGMGIYNQGIEPFIANKETLLYDNSKNGSRHALTGKGLTYDSVFETTNLTDNTRENDRKGTAGPKNQVNKNQYEDSQVTQDGYNAVSTQDYFGNNTAFIKKDINRRDFVNSVRNDYEELNAGLHYNPGYRDIGDDGKRTQGIMVQQDQVVPGTMNSGLARDSKKSYVDIEYNLKNNKNEPDASLFGMRTQPLADEVYKSEYKIKDLSSENTRLDRGIALQNQKNGPYGNDLQNNRIGEMSEKVNVVEHRRNPVPIQKIPKSKVTANPFPWIKKKKTS